MPARKCKTPPAPLSLRPNLTPSPDRSYKLFLYHTNTQREVAGSPISFDVMAADVSPAHCSHSLEDSALLAVESIADSVVMLSVDAADKFNNTILDSPDFTVSIDDTAYPLDPPRYEHPLSIPAGTDAAFEIVFMHDGAAFHEPLALVVAPPESSFSSENVMIVAFASMYVIPRANC